MSARDSRGRSLVAFGAVVAVLALAGCTHDKDAVSTKIGEAVSASAEGEILARLEANGSTATPYVEIHSAELHKVAGNAAEALEAETEAPYRATATKAAREARKAEAQLYYLHASPGDPGVAARVEANLKVIGDHLSGLESRL